MGRVAELLFSISILAVVYSYAGYPTVLWIVSHFKRENKSRPSGDIRPTVSLLISAHNEEASIEEKVLNSLQLSYPKDRLEIVVISDGSTDRTDQIVSRFISDGVVLRAYEGRIGKTACLNRAVPLAKGEVIVFSDANSRYDSQAIERLIAHFDDTRIGFVTGLTTYVAANGGESPSESISLYSRIERVTKVLESRIGSCVGADGAIFAVRKTLYRTLREFDINDLVVPLDVVRQGFRGIIEVDAYCTEKVSGGTKGTFYRQVRIVNRTIRAIMNNIDMLNPLRFGFFAFELFSHKLSKLLSPFLLLIAFVSNLFLLRNGAFYLASFLLQLSLYSLALLGHRGTAIPVLSRLAGVARTFVVVNAAVLLAWIMYFKGEMYTTWTVVR